LGIFGHRFAARNRRKTSKELDSEEISSLKRTNQILKDGMTNMEIAHAKEIKAFERASKLEERITGNFIKDEEDGLIQKLPVKWKGKGIADGLATYVENLKDGTVPGLNVQTKAMASSLIKENEELIGQLGPGLILFLLQRAPPELLAKIAPLMSMTDAVKEKGK